VIAHDEAGGCSSTGRKAVLLFAARLAQEAEGASGRLS